MKTVAAISFRDNHSISMDVDAVSHVEISAPIQLEDGSWCAELLVRSGNGTIALQLTAASPGHLQVRPQGLE
ncbi:hypothetical protein [Magnetospirillum sp. UT-4]|uniref:hypothetical protein n=1 Tax=Magnetospirillum sp. UT-4 TaxID=2681467 RepID=UPI001383FCDE|nr:hypothetical protein [Magnetospirillum sp. UT-4]CAA7621465.1 conserved hypothetical protein [Magnetospirillum sp. UT-4]